MHSGVVWVGIVAPTVSLIVSVYLVWRAIRDERRFVRQERERRLRSREPDWLPDPDAWRDDIEEWKPGSSPWDSDDSQWTPGSEGGLGTSGLDSPSAGSEEWLTDGEDWRSEAEQWRPEAEDWHPDPEEWRPDPDE